MSSEAEILVLPLLAVGVGAAVVIGVAAYGSAIAAAELGKGTAEVAILASEVATAAVVGVVDSFRDEYRGMLADIEERDAAERLRQERLAAEGQKAAAAAGSRARGTHVEATVDASAEMVRRQADSLARRVEAAEGVPAGLVERCRALQAAAGGADAQGTAADIVALAGELAAWAAEASRSSASGEDGQRELIASLARGVLEVLSADALLVGVDPVACAAIRADVASCERLAQRQPRLALRSLAAAQARLQDELAAARGRIHEQERGRAFLAEHRSEIEAQLKTVCAQARPEAYRARAAFLLAKQEEYATAGASLAEASALQAEAERLFTQSAADLATAALDDFAAGTVRDVLAELGCQVREVEGGVAETSAVADRFLADLGGGYGVEFTVASGAKVRTELIGLAADVPFDQATEDRACGLVVAVTEALRWRDIDASPGPRRRNATRGRPRVVVTAAQARRKQSAAAKRRTAGGKDAR